MNIRFELPQCDKQNFIIAFKHSTKLLLSSHNVTVNWCCLVMPWSLTMTSRQLQFKFLRPLPYGVKSPILTTNIDVEIPPSGTHNWSNARRMPRKGMMLMSLLHGDIIWWIYSSLQFNLSFPAYLHRTSSLNPAWVCNTGLRQSLPPPLWTKCSADFDFPEYFTQAISTSFWFVCYKFDNLLSASALLKSVSTATESCEQ